MHERDVWAQAAAPTELEEVDQQFWTIIVALCSLTAAAAGAMLGLADGWWKWGGLVALPAALAGSIVLFRRLGNQRLRRSLQFGAILSLAIHLVIVLVSSRIAIFGGYTPVVQPQAQPRHRPRVVHVAAEAPARRVWQETNRVALANPTDDASMERTERQPTATQRSQPLPVVDAEITVDPELVRREQTVHSSARTEMDSGQPARTREIVAPETAETNVTGLASPGRQSPPELVESQPLDVADERSAATAAAERQRAAVLAPQLVDARTDSQPTAASDTDDPRSNFAARDQLRRRLEREQVDAPSDVEFQSNPRSSASSEPQVDSSAVADAPARRRQRARPERSSTEAPAEPSLRGETSADSRPARTAAQEDEPLAADLSGPERRERRQMPRSSNPETIASRSAAQAEPFGETSQPRSTSVDRSAATQPNLDRTAPSSDSAPGADRSLATMPSGPERRSANLDEPSGAVPPSLLSRAERSGSTAGQPLTSATAEPAATVRSSRSSRRPVLSANRSASLDRAASTGHRGSGAADRAESDVDATDFSTAQSSADRPNGRAVDQADGDLAADRSGQRRGDRLATNSAPGGSTRAGALTGATESSRGSSIAAEPSDRAASAPRAGGDLPGQAAPRRATTGDGDALEFSPGSLTETGPRTHSNRGAAAADVMGESDDEAAGARRGGTGSASVAAPQGTLQADALEPGSGAPGGSRGTVDVPQRDVVAERSSGSSGGVQTVTRTAPAASPGGSDALGQLTEPGERRELAGGASSPEPVAGGTSPGARRRDASRSALPLADTGTGDSPLATSPSGSGQALTATTDSTGEISRQTAGGAVTRPRSDLDPGVTEGPVSDGENRTRRNDSQIAPPNDSVSPSRLRREDVGGTLAVNPNASFSRDAFRNRQAGGGGRSSPQTEAAIELGLAFLARYQASDGSWHLEQFDVDHPTHANQLTSDTAATGLAILAFQGAGYHHLDYRYADRLKRAIDWMVSHQKPDGDLYVSADSRSNENCRLYSHAIAALALCEAYGMTQDPELRQPAQLAIDHIVAAQDRQYGGWRYQPGAGADTSVTGWMMMALQSGRLAGLDVNDEALKGIERWLSVAHDPASEHLFRYNPYAVDEATVRRSHTRVPTPCMTSVGLLMRLYGGWDRSDPRMIAGAEYLLRELPGDDTTAERDTYYWYYATQVLRHIGGPAWDEWHGRLHPLLIRTQVPDGDMAGSWDPYEPVADRWAAQGGRLYVTTMNLLSLEVDYRLLPLYESTSR
jgi:hypothetical protein